MRRGVVFATLVCLVLAGFIWRVRDLSSPPLREVRASPVGSIAVNSQVINAHPPTPGAAVPQNRATAQVSQSTPASSGNTMDAGPPIDRALAVDAFAAEIAREENSETGSDLEKTLRRKKFAAQPAAPALTQQADDSLNEALNEIPADQRQRATIVSVECKVSGCEILIAENDYRQRLDERNGVTPEAPVDIAALAAKLRNSSLWREPGFDVYHSEMQRRGDLLLYTL